jgi:hypothetical protein
MLIICMQMKRKPSPAHGVEKKMQVSAGEGRVREK